MPWYVKLLDKFEGRVRWAFDPLMFVWVSLAIGALIGLLQVSGWPNNTAAVVAIFGALMASLGVITLGRPVIRVGGYNAWLKKMSVIGGGSYAPTPDEIEEARQVRLDAIAIQLSGPGLVIVGTLTNGISGFFA